MRETYRRGYSPTLRRGKDRPQDNPPASVPVPENENIIIAETESPVSPPSLDTTVVNASVASAVVSGNTVEFQPVFDSAVKTDSVTATGTSEEAMHGGYTQEIALKYVRRTAKAANQAATKVASAPSSHAVDTDLVVQEAFRQSRGGRHSRRKGRNRRGSAAKGSFGAYLGKLLLILLFIAASAKLFSGTMLTEAAPDNAPNLTRLRLTAEPLPTPGKDTRKVSKAIDFGAVPVVVLDGLSGDSRFNALGNAFGAQLALFGKLNGVETRYIKSEAAAFSSEYAKLIASNSMPTFVLGTYEALAPLAQDFSDITAVSKQLKINQTMAAFSADKRLLTLTVEFYGIYVRQDLWKGGMPASYEALAVGAEKLGGKAPQFYPLGLPLDGSGIGETFCRDTLQAWGVDLANPAAANVDDAAAALAWFEGLFQEKLSPPDAFYWGAPEALNSIKNGVSAVTVYDNSLLKSLDGDIAAKMALVLPLKGPKGRASSVVLTAMAMPKGGNAVAARHFLDKYVATPRLLGKAFSGDTSPLVPTVDSIFQAQSKQKDNPWAMWLNGLQGVTFRQSATPPGSRTVSQAVKSMVLGGYSPQEAAAWLLGKR